MHRTHAPPLEGDVDAELMASHEKMTNESMEVSLTGNADHDFVILMIPHHQGAIDMAVVQLKYGLDPELRRKAQSIIDDRKVGVAELEAWLNTHPL